MTTPWLFDILIAAFSDIMKLFSRGCRGTQSPGRGAGCPRKIPFFLIEEHILEMQVENLSSTTKDIDDEQTSATHPTEMQPRWRSMLEPWWNATLAVLPIFIGTRLLFVLLTYFGVVLFTVANYSPQE